jgi:hypothetical protein
LVLGVGLGVGYAFLILYLLLGYEGKHEMPLGSLMFIPLGLACAWYALRQIMRPAPRRSKLISQATDQK